VFVDLCFDDTTFAYDACFHSDRLVMGGSGCVGMRTRDTGDGS